MAVLVIADHDNAHLRDTTHKTVTAAPKLSSATSTSWSPGKGAQAVADAAAKIAGVRKVLLAESDALGKQRGRGRRGRGRAADGRLRRRPDARPPRRARTSPRASPPSSTWPRSPTWSRWSTPTTFVRPIYAGNALETVQSSDAKKVITVRPTAFKAAAEGGSAPVENDRRPGRAGQDPLRRPRSWSSRSGPSWARAKIVVSGGRAMGSAEEFQR